MKLLSKLFKAKPRKTFEVPDIGPFTLDYSSKAKNSWSIESDDVLIVVRGSVDEPFAEHLSFIRKIDSEIQKFSDRISEKFRTAFLEAEQDVHFQKWEDAFRIEAIEITLVHEGDVYWNVTFEQLDAPYYHFTIFVEGNILGPDFAIDS
jgi:hypothetical protein